MADLRWVLSIVDRATGPAKNVQKSLKGVSGALKGMKLDGLDQAWKKMGGSAMGAVGIAAGGLAAVAAAAGAAAVAVGKYSASEAMENEALDWQLKQIIKDTGAFDAAIGDVRSLASILGEDPKLIEKQLTKLVSKGHAVGDAFKIIQGAADLKALHPEAASLVDAFTQLDDKGKLGAKSIAAMGAAGLDTKKLRDVLGVASGDDDDIEAIEKAIKSSAISVADLQNAALKAIVDTTGKELGGAAKDFSDNTWSGIISSLQSAPARIVKAVDLGGAMEPAKKALGALVDALDPQKSETGKQFAAMLKDVGTAVGDMLAKVSVEDVIAAVKAFASFLDTTIELTGAIFGGLWEGLSFIMQPIKDLLVQLDDGESKTTFWKDSLKLIGQVVGFVVGAIVIGVGAIIFVVVGAIGLLGKFFKGVWIGIKQVPEALGDMVDGFADGFDSLFAYLGDVWQGIKDFGGAIVDGLLAGIKGAWGTLKNGWNELISTLPASVATKLEIKSPSRTMMRLGEYTAEGFAVGVDKGADGVQSSLSSAVTPPSVSLSSLASAGASGRRASGGGSITVGDIYIDASGVNGDTKALVHEVRAQMLAVFREASMELGAA